MLKYSLKRILLAFITAFIIITLTFFLVKSLPGARIFAPQEHTRFAFYNEQVLKGYVIDCSVESPQYGELLEKIVDLDNIEHYYYQTPIFDQYFAWLKRIVTAWDWGTSTVIKPTG